MERFDHHCDWINNCVGGNNHKYFLLLILFLVIEIIYTIFLTVYQLGFQFQNKRNGFENDTGLAQIYNQMVQNFYTYHHSIYIAQGILLLFGLIDFIFFFPILALFILHIRNFFANKTTNERYSRSKRHETITTLIHNGTDSS